jgi:serine/threonine protein kinase
MDNRLGTQLGHYRLVQSLGSGGFGEVYLAQDVVLHRQVAIKVLNTTLADDRKQRFYTEARRIASLSHQHIVPIIDLGIAEDRPYVVSDFVSGESLRDKLIDREWASLSTLVSCVKQLADALQYAHNQNIIHRDLKPSNIFLAENGELLLTDFSIAVIMDEAHRSTKVFSDDHLLVSSECHEQRIADLGALDMQGTVTYMAPEQVEGVAQAASDQYSLAVVVYEWLTGELPPLLGSPQERWVDWAQIRQKEDLPITLSDSSISSEIEQVLCKALAKHPEDRYVDVVTFAAALQVAAERDQSYPVMWYKQRLEEYEQGLRTEMQSDQEIPLQEERPLELLIRCLTKPYVEKALAQLSWVERSCLLLHIDAQFAPHEIAEILDIEESSVQEHLDRGRQRLLGSYTSLLRKEQGIAVGPQALLSTGDPILRAERLIHSLPRT